MKKMLVVRAGVFAKSHVSGYTRKDGTYVAEHEDKRVKHAEPQQSQQGPQYFGWTQDSAREIVEDDGDVPNGWFVHGRKDGDKLTDNWPIQMTADSSTATGYAGSRGSVWAIRPNAKTKVADFSDYGGEDLGKFIDALQARWEDDRLEIGSPVGAVVNAIADRDGVDADEVSFADFEDYVRDTFIPSDIVSSAGAFDSDLDMELLRHYPGGFPDLVKTPDGAVVMPGSARNVDAVNLSAVSRGGETITKSILILPRKVRV